MDFLGYNVLRTQKSNRVFGNIAKVLRILELCFVLVLVLWVFNKLPFAVRISGEFLRYVSGVISSPLFVFLLCNVIVAILVAKSGKFSGDENVDTELYDELMKSAPKQLPELSPATVEEVVYQDKEVILEPPVVVTRQRPEKYSESESESEEEKPREYRRTKSEKLTKVTKKKILRRSATEKLPEKIDDGETLSPPDEMSDEDFHRTVDEFIKKQRIFLTQECFIESQSLVAEIQCK